MLSKGENLTLIASLLVMHHSSSYLFSGKYEQHSKCPEGRDKGRDRGREDRYRKPYPSRHILL
jgi:hypothetical protein